MSIVIGNRKLWEGKIFLPLLMFIYLYIPPILSCNTMYLIGVIPYLYLINVWRGHGLKLKLLRWYAVLIYCALHLLVSCVIGEADLSRVAGAFLYLVVFSFPCAIALKVFTERHGYSLSDVAQSVAGAAVIQAGISLSMYLVPIVQDVFLYLMSNTMSTDFMDFWKAKRLFGYASGLTFSMPILQAMLGMLLIFYAIEKRKITGLMIALAIITSGILCARTAIIIVIIGFACLFLHFCIRNLSRALILSVFFISLYIVFSCSLDLRTENDAIEQIARGWTEISALFNGSATGYFNELLSDNPGQVGVKKLPSGAGFILGGSFVRTDIGYIHDIHSGGLLFVSILYAWFIFNFIKAGKFAGRRFGHIAYAATIFLGLSFFTVNIKGHIFSNNGVTHFILLIFIFMLFTPLKELKGYMRDV